MKIITRFFTLLIYFAIFILISCNKGDEPSIKLQEMFECHHEENWDSTKIHNKLINEWEWEFVSCYSSLGDYNNVLNKGLSIEFKSDNTLIVKQDGETTQVSEWKINDHLQLDVEPRVIQLYGVIYFCEDKLTFINSYIDVCDNYFIEHVN